MCFISFILYIKCLSICLTFLTAVPLSFFLPHVHIIQPLSVTTPCISFLLFLPAHLTTSPMAMSRSHILICIILCIFLSVAIFTVILIFPAFLIHIIPVLARYISSTTPIICVVMLLVFRLTAFSRVHCRPAFHLLKSNKN